MNRHATKLFVKLIFCLIILFPNPSPGKTLDDNFLLNTVYVENLSTGNRGTGFITVRKIDEERFVWFLISNKQVLMPRPLAPEQADNCEAEARISINILGANDIVKITFLVKIRHAEGNVLVKGHPNKDVDVAGLIITPYLRDIVAIPDKRVLGIPEDRFADEEFLKKNFISIGDDALVVGYPLGLVEEGHVIPIARGVRIASKPDYDFRKQPVFLVDGTFTRGTSGSPVILSLRPRIRTEKNVIDISKIQENHLLGIVSASIKDWEIVIRKVVTFEAAQEFSVIDNANLGIVFKVRTVSEVMDRFGLERWEKEKPKFNKGDTTGGK
jgi:hypothetical protein